MIPRPPYSLDDVLRAARFKIHARPRSGPVLWRRTGDTPMQESAALMLVAVEISGGKLKVKK